MTGLRDSEEVIKSLDFLPYLSSDSFCGWTLHMVKKIATGFGTHPNGREMLSFAESMYQISYGGSILRAKLINDSLPDLKELRKER